MKHVLEDVERAFRYHREGNTVTPMRAALPIGAADVTVLYMPSDIGAVRQAGRESDAEITLFKSVGVAFLDVVVAHGVYRLALEKNVGIRIAWT